MTPTTAVTCPACSAPVGAQEQYCEACGTELGSPATSSSSQVAAKATDSEEPAGDRDATVPGPGTRCHECDGAVAADGYCTQCGAKARSPRDHLTEQPATWVAGVCDRGVRHSRNEDALALDARAEPGSHAILVVCDGVSNSVDSDVASLAAARAARDVLASSSPSGIGTAAGRVAATSHALDAAVDAANEAVISHTVEGPGNPASCTFVAAVVDATLLVVGWVGDSRAYWLPDSGEPQMLTIDDSSAAEQIASGTPRKDAESGPQAHAITRWLGIDAPDHTPHTHSVNLESPGWVLVCSDGLWNYCSEAGDLWTLVQELVAGSVTGSATDPLALAAALVDWANVQGGADNITAALARIDPHGPSESPPHAAESGQPGEQTETTHTREGAHDGNVLS